LSQIELENSLVQAKLVQQPVELQHTVTAMASANDKIWTVTDNRVFTITPDEKIFTLVSLKDDYTNI
jgi:hypothetical protein